MDFNEIAVESMLKQRLAELRAAAARERLLASLPRRRRNLGWRHLAAALAATIARTAVIGRSISVGGSDRRFRPKGLRPLGLPGRRPPTGGTRTRIAPAEPALDR